MPISWARLLAEQNSLLKKTISMIFTKTIKITGTLRKISPCIAINVGRMDTLRNGAQQKAWKIKLNVFSAWEITRRMRARAMCASSATQWGIELKIVCMIIYRILCDAECADKKAILLKIAVSS